MLTIEKRNKFKIIIDLLTVIMCGFFLALLVYLTVLFILNLKWNNAWKYSFGLIILLFGIVIFCWLIYQFITKIISENFIIEFNDDYFIFKSISIKESMRYEDIESIYIVQRGKYHSKGRIDFLKVHSKLGKVIFISFEVLNKKEEKELKRIFKEKTGKKVHSKYQFWE